MTTARTLASALLTALAVTALVALFLAMAAAVPEANYPVTTTYPPAPPAVPVPMTDPGPPSPTCVEDEVPTTIDGKAGCRHIEGDGVRVLPST